MGGSFRGAERPDRRTVPVIPAKAGTSWRKVSAGLPEAPASAGVTGSQNSVSDTDLSAQIFTWLPISTTRLGGRPKNSIGLSALRIIQAKSFSRQIAIPWTVEMSGVWRERKKLV